MIGRIIHRSQFGSGRPRSRGSPTLAMDVELPAGLAGLPDELQAQVDELELPAGLGELPDELQAQVDELGELPGVLVGDLGEPAGVDDLAGPGETHVSCVLVCCQLATF